MNIGQTKYRIAVVLFAISSGVAVANPGDFDETYNGLGFTRDFVPGLDNRSDLAIHSSGEIVTIMASGSGPALWRHLPDGTLDTRFGGTGRVLPPTPPDYGGGQRVAIDNLNRILFLGVGSEGHLMYRLNFDGTLDPSFGTNGSVQIPFGGTPSNPQGIAVQSDNKIIGAGGILGPSRFIAYRLDESGQLDPTFGGSGIVFTEVTPGGGVDRAWAVALQADGKIVATGRARPLGPTNFDYALVRYLPTGALDPDFGNGGKVVIHILDMNFGKRLAIQPDGKILMTGSACRDLGMDQIRCSPGTIRVDARGSPDPTFGAGGTVLTDLGGHDSGAEDVVLQPDGKILVAGNVSYGDPRGVSNAIVLRYLPDGSLDASFGEGGVSETNYGYYSNVAFTVRVQADGRTVTGAATGGPAPNSAVIARYRQ